MNAVELAKEWLKYSKSDLVTASHMFEDVTPKEIEISCYHSQQCAEKALKAFCFLNKIEPPKTHDLIALCHLCITVDNSFSLTLDNCSKLNPYGVSARYPNELSVDEPTAKQAVSMAEKIYNFCLLKIQK